VAPDVPRLREVPLDEGMGVNGTELRQFAEWELGEDGYPFAWHGRCACDALGDPGRGECVYDDPCASTKPLRVAIKDLVREQAGHRCVRCGHPYRKGEHGNGEWSPCDRWCTHGSVATRLAETNVVDGQIVFQEAQWRILTVHHLDEDKANCRWWNLAALCQRCHLRMQRAVVMGRPYHYEHSAWFRPYAAGFYAWKYEGVDLDRAETELRMPELLAYEHRFTQETLL
jgi:hypothetical protein